MNRALSTVCLAALIVGAGVGPSARAQDAAPVVAPVDQSKPAVASLELGLPAPTLKNATWIKGEPVTEWVKGQIYILDFWATWCAPCIAAMPHINEIQKVNAEKGVNVIGVAIWPRPRQRDTKAFVEQQGEKMSYRVCADDPAGTNAKAFMEATGSGGIPTVMIIDREGKLAWVGHPMDGMDEVLAKIIDGSYDVNAVAKERKEDQAKLERSRELMLDFQKAQMAEKWEEAVSVADKMIAHDAELFGKAAVYKYVIILTKLNDSTRAAEVGRTLLEGSMKENEEFLTLLGRIIAEEESIPNEGRDFELALKAATKADELSEGKNPDALTALAVIAFNNKDYPKAHELQSKAFELVKDHPQIGPGFQSRLDEYATALKKSKEGGENSEATPASE